MLSRIITISSRQLNGPVMWARSLFLGLFVAILVMWLCNIIGLQALNLVFAIAGFIAFFFLAMSPRLIVQSGILGGVFAFLMDRDKTQGIASGPYWLFKATLILCYGFVFAAFTLATWSFQASPGSFWIMFIGVLALMMLEQITQKKSDWGRIIMTGYITLCIIVALLKTLGGPFTEISNQPNTWFGWFEQIPGLEGQLLNWWPLGLIIVLVALMQVKQLRTIATMGITVVALVWIFTGAPKLFGDTFDNFTLIGHAKPNPCAFQNNLVVPEGKMLRITLCSQHLEYKNIMSIQRVGPRPVKVEFADSTLALYGDQLRGRKAEEFVSLQEADSLGQNFHFLAMPNNDEFYKIGLHLVPLDFTIKYATVDVPD